MAAWSRMKLKIFEIFKFCVCFGKTTLTVKFCEILFRKFSSRHRSTCFAQISWNLADGKSVKSCVIFFTQKKQNFAGLSSCRYCAIAPKICAGQPPITYSECSRFHPNRFTFGGVTAERVNTAKTRRKVNPIFGWSYSFEPNNKVGFARSFQLPIHYAIKR